MLYWTHGSMRGQKILIDYKAGGGGALGRRELVKSRPDGYLMAGINIPHIILQPLQQEVGYKTEQIVPISLFQRTILALAVLNTSQFKTLEQFIDCAKKSPGALTAGGAGTFSGPHMASLRFEKLASAKITYVPLTGAAPQTMAFLGGHTAAAFANSDDLLRYKDTVRVLAFASEARSPMAPMVLATVLAQMLETSLQHSLLISRGSPLVFFTRPIAAAFMALALLSIIRGIRLEVRSRTLEVAEEDEA